MKIEMHSEQTGSENGIHVKTFHKGEIYEIEDSLGNAFVNMAVAKKIEVESEMLSVDESEPEVKMQESPENKALNTESYENKSKSKRR